MKYQTEQSRYFGQPLSPREKIVLRMMSEGKHPIEIGKALHVCAGTVSMYRNRIGHKSGCKTSLQIGAWAVRQGLV
jgi:DNA-binding NarL/FixJ family response regulator